MATRLRAACFWAAIVLPFLHVPLLLSGLSTQFQTTVFLGLLLGNLVALAIGHSHRQDGAASRR